MKNMIISLNVVLPLFITMVLGYFLRKKNFIDKKSLNALNNVVFKIFLPLYLFTSVYKTNLEGVVNPKLILFSIIGLTILFIILCLIIPFIEKDNKKIGVMIQGIFRSNFVIFGFPIAESLFPESEMAKVAVLIAVIIPIFNVLAVISLEMYRNGRNINIGKILRGIMKNPLIIGTALGIIALFLNIRFPSAVEKTASNIARMATPLSLMILGGTVEFTELKNYYKQVSIVVISKLILVPLIVIPIAVYFGFRDIEILILLIMFGAPTAVSSFSMAQQMDGDAELAAQIVIFTTLGCILTFFIGIFTLKELYLI